MTEHRAGSNSSPPRGAHLEAPSPSLGTQLIARVRSRACRGAPEFVESTACRGPRESFAGLAGSSALGGCARRPGLWPPSFCRCYQGGKSGARQKWRSAPAQYLLATWKGACGGHTHLLQRRGCDDLIYQEVLRAARIIYPAVRIAPLVRSEWLSSAAAGSVHLQLECHQVFAPSTTWLAVRDKHVVKAPRQPCWQ